MPTVQDMHPAPRTSPLPFLAFVTVWLTPLLALAQARTGNPRGTHGGPIWWFWVAAIAVIFLFWTVRVLRKRGGPPPIDPNLRGPRNASR